MAATFSSGTRQTSAISGKALLAAAIAVIVLTAVVAFATLRREPVGSNVPDSYAGSVTFSGIELSEATNGAGGKVTYVDGVVKNNGSRVLQSAAVQVSFAEENGAVAQTYTVPLTLIRTREPYVDLEPVSAEPILPAGSHAFRMIFEAVPENWNQKEPAIRLANSVLK